MTFFGRFFIKESNRLVGASSVSLVTPNKIKKQHILYDKIR